MGKPPLKAEVFLWTVVARFLGRMQRCLIRMQ